MRKKTGKRNKEYVSPKVEKLIVEFEQSIAAGSATVNTGADGSSSQTPREREYESGWSNSRDFDL